MGNTIRLQPTQEQLGYFNGDQCLRSTCWISFATDHEDEPDFEIEWKVTSGQRGDGGRQTRAGDTGQHVSIGQSDLYPDLRPGLHRAMDAVGQSRPGAEHAGEVFPGTLATGAWVRCLLVCAQTADPRGMVALSWLFLGYLLHTTGELCLSPVGLSMITKLSPRRLISTVMGAWFLATAVSQLAAGIIAQFTGVTEGESSTIPIPKETVHVYGDVFGKVAIAAGISAVLCFAISPLLTRWMHEESATGEGETV